MNSTGILSNRNDFFLSWKNFSLIFVLTNRLVLIIDFDVEKLNLLILNFLKRSVDDTDAESDEFGFQFARRRGS